LSDSAAFVGIVNAGQPAFLRASLIHPEDGSGSYFVLCVYQPLCLISPIYPQEVGMIWRINKYNCLMLATVKKSVIVGESEAEI